MNRKPLTLLFTAGLFILFLWFASKIPYCGWDFRNSLWGPASMLIHHQTPYTTHTPYGAYAGVWMPTAVGLFFFLGALSCDLASKIWLAAGLAGFVWVIWMIAGYKMPSRGIFFICVLVLFAFPPLWLHIILGQFSMLFVIILMAAVYIPKAEPFVPLLLALGLTKPQLAILIYPGLLLSTWRKKGIKAAAQLILFTGLGAGLLTLPLFLFYPGWVKDFLGAMFNNFGVTWDLPTLFVQLPLLWGSAGTVVWGMVLLAAMGISLWLWYARDPKIALLISLAATPMVTTYASSWDFLLLMPIFFWLMIHLKSITARALLLSGMGLIIGVQIALRWHQDYPDGLQWWIPPVLILVYLISLAVENQVFQKAKTHLFPRLSA